MDAGTFYEQVGGRGWFKSLVARFYEGVAADPVLRPLYPADLDEACEHLTAFLVQVSEGPAESERTRGHPMLRRRHVPFAIGVERDAWCRHMSAAVRSAGLAPVAEADLLVYFEEMATHLVNRTPGDSPDA